MRRVPKPFTVEIRSASRKPKSQAGPTWPQLDERPSMTWPELAAEPYRDPRQPPPQEPNEPAALPKPTGRILPVIEDVTPPLKPVARKQARSTEVQVKPVTQVALIAPPSVAPTPARKRSRPNRQDFKRSERWKARLPVWARKRASAKAASQD